MQNPILTAVNAALKVTNYLGNLGTRTLSGIPLGTSDGTATGTLGVKTLIVGGTVATTGGLTNTQLRATPVPVSIGNVTLNGADIEIGAVELKDGSTDNRVVVNSLGKVQAVLQGAPNAAVSNKTASATGIVSLAARATRRSVSIVNLDDSPETIYYGFATGVDASTGARLKAGQSQGVDTTSAIFFFGTAGTGTIQCVETFD